MYKRQGGGVKKGAKEFKNNPFFVINPDTLWINKYSEEVQSLEKEYFTNKRPCLLLVKKELSLDNSFKGDFNLKNNLISKDEKNQFIFTGLQIMKNDHLAFFNKNIFKKNHNIGKFIDFEIFLDLYKISSHIAIPTSIPPSKSILNL